MSDVSNLTRLTVNLLPRSAAALDMAAAIEGTNRTDAVNRALQLYAQLVQHRELGGDVLLRRGDVTELITWV